MRIPVTMRSLITGKNNTRMYEMTKDQIHQYTSYNRPNIQDIFPDMSNEDREFLMTGITPEEWVVTFGVPTPEEEENNG